jgi:TPR repeat protein
MPPRIAQLALVCLWLTPCLAMAEEPGAKTIQLLTGRDYTALEAHLVEVRNRGRLAGRWTTALEAELNGVTERVGEPKSLIRYTNEWCRKSPRSAWPFLLRAELAMAQAWIQRRQRRSRTRTENTSYLDYARRDLDYARGVRPKLALVLARRITVMTVQNDSRYRAERLQGEAIRIDRGDVSAALAYAEYLLPQWNGSSGDALDFAQDFARVSGKPARDYVLLWVHSQIADENYLDNNRRERTIRTLARRLDSTFPNSYKTHLAAADIYAATAKWKEYADSLQTAAKLGHVESMRRVATYLVSGERGFHKDANAAFEWRERLARQGDTQAMVDLAWQFLRGQAVPKDSKRGLTWLERAARLDSAAAHTALGQVYAGGEVAEQDLTRARRHLEEGRRLGDPRAAFELGCLYNRGDFGDRDAERATRLLVEAGKGGEVEAWLYLGRCYESTSVQNALHYYRLAREEGGEIGRKASLALLLLLRKHADQRRPDDPQEVIDPTIKR